MRADGLTCARIGTASLSNNTSWGVSASAASWAATRSRHVTSGTTGEYQGCLGAIPEAKMA
jgi:hypothetical protein